MWLANILGKGQIQFSNSSMQTAKLEMDFSSKCYLFCECNSVRIGQDIQNEVSLERFVFADVVAYHFINLNWNKFSKL